MKQEIPKGFCQCGCGGRTSIATRTRHDRGDIKGYPVKFIEGHCNSRKSGENHPNWKGGKATKRGYLIVASPGHPRANNGYVPEHILRAEKALGKSLPNSAVVHHANGLKNNGPLVICQDQGYHNLLHRRMRALKACGHANWLKCPYCKQYDNPKNMYLRPNKNEGLHQSCENEYQRKRKNKIKGVQNG